MQEAPRGQVSSQSGVAQEMDSSLRHGPVGVKGGNGVAAEHWEQVYRTEGPEQVNWFQAEARLSRQWIEKVAPDRGSAILDIGAGVSTLVDCLLASSYRNLTIGDLSPAALRLTRNRLSPLAAPRPGRLPCAGPDPPALSAHSAGDGPDGLRPDPAGRMSPTSVVVCPSRAPVRRTLATSPARWHPERWSRPYSPTPSAGAASGRVI